MSGVLNNQQVLKL